ncbi:MAG: amidohydrolase family protein, partial [Longimicrobiales bacterium]
ELNGRTLAAVAEDWSLPVPATVRRILEDGNASVMNRDLYDPENTRYLAQKSWMMTCTDGRTPSPETVVSHPRPYGALTKKLRDYVLDESLLEAEFAVRSMTGLAADFLGLPDRGYIREGMKADVAVLDPETLRDRATYEDSRRLSEGTVHVLVNGGFALRNRALTDGTQGRTVQRPASR